MLPVELSYTINTVRIL